MSHDRLSLLCEKLSDGDLSAAEDVFRSYEPYLRMVVRRQLSPRLRAKFDSIDVVQSVWANVLDGLRDASWEFRDEAQLRSFLIRMAMNRLVSMYRHHRTSLERDQPLGGPGFEHALESREDRPSEVVQANEVWDQLLALAPPSHHEVLVLKTKGVSLADIATRTGMHESSVRRILYNLEDRFNASRSPRPSRLKADCA